MNKSFVSFDSAIDQYLKNGGTGTTFYNPVMHYDLETMGKNFTAVDENAGIYMRDGAFYATVDLGGKKSLQPVGIAGGKAEGLSESLSGEQKELFEKMMERMKELKEKEGLSDEAAQQKLMELVKDPEKLAEMKKEENSDSSQESKQTHGK